jgi:hypothetical protein
LRSWKAVASAVVLHRSDQQAQNCTLRPIPHFAKDQCGLQRRRIKRYAGTFCWRALA